MTTQDQQQDNPLDLDVEHFRARVLQDALAEATSSYWLRRAVELEAVGTPTADASALACRRHATLVRFRTPDTEDLATDALREVD